jgi:ectoine hydroxylase-related dioxygenase (phytanoyl-CoA dioxygenase family)
VDLVENMTDHSDRTLGFDILHGVLDECVCDTLTQYASAANGQGIGSRGLLAHDWCRALAKNLQTHCALSQLIPSAHIAAQCNYFEKSSANNWLVPYHQDLSIPVAQRIEHPDLLGWSKKEDVWFVQAPLEVLRQMIAIRIHLDDCGENDGALRVLGGTHRLGLIDTAQIPKLKANATEQLCCVPKGGVLALSPLLLHASSKSTGTRLRRVLHLVYGPLELPYGLRWKSAV